MQGIKRAKAIYQQLLIIEIYVLATYLIGSIAKTYTSVNCLKLFVLIYSNPLTNIFYKLWQINSSYLPKYIMYTEQNSLA